MQTGFELDGERLSQYLEHQLPEFRGPVRVEKFAKGQSNPTYRLFSQGADYVLRRKPPGKLLKSAHAVDREYRVIKALAGSNVPVANAFHYCDDDTVIGSVFYIMEYVQGRVLWDPTMPELSPAQRAAHYDAMNSVLVELHKVDVQSVGLQDYGRPEGYIDRQIALWSRQYRASETDHVPDMEWLLTNLQDAKPEEDERVALVHGDFRLDNMIFNDNKAEVMALMDWELSTLGHPFSDLAYQCMQLRMPHVGLMSGLAGIDRASLGIPTEAEYVAAYCGKMQIDEIPGWPFYLAFSFFRFAAILQGVKKRALEGNASSDQALQMGEYVSPLATMGREQIA